MVLAGGAVAAPATPPVVLGVLVADGAPPEVCPAMLASPEALLWGRLEAFSPVAALPEACVLALGAVVCTLGAPVAGAAEFAAGVGDWDVEGVWVALCGFSVLCEAIVLDVVVDPVTEEAWLFGFVLVALVSPFVGLVAPGIDMLWVRGAETEPPVFTSCWLLFLLAERRRWDSP